MGSASATCSFYDCLSSRWFETNLFFFTRTYSVDWEHAIKDKPVVLWVEEILLCLNVLNRPVVLVEECKCTCAPSLKFWNRTLNSEWLVTDSKAFSWTVPNQPCYGNVYGLVIECKRHTCFVLTFVSPEPGDSLFFLMNEFWNEL